MKAMPASSSEAVMTSLARQEMKPSAISPPRHQINAGDLVGNDWPTPTEAAVFFDAICEQEQNKAFKMLKRQCRIGHALTAPGTQRDAPRSLRRWP